MTRRRTATRASVNVVYDSKPETTEHSLIVPIGKSKADVTSNKRQHSRYCTAEADRHEPSRGLSAIAQLLVIINFWYLSLSACVQLSSTLHKLQVPP